MAPQKAPAKKVSSARKVKEIIVEIEDTRGTLAEILELLGEHRINLLGYTALHLGNVGVLHLLPDRAAGAAKALGKSRATRISTSDIVYAVSKDKIGGGGELTRKLADAGINIHYSYATSGGSRNFGVAFQTEDNARAVRVLNR